MIIHNSCNEAVRTCISDQYFAIAHLYSNEKTMNLHIHDCYEIYFSIHGGRQFLIDHSCYDIVPGDVFFINTTECHYLSQVEREVHERIVLSISPQFLEAQSSDSTDLRACFEKSLPAMHKLHLSDEEQKRFLYFIHKLSGLSGYGADVIEKAVFSEMMVFLNSAYTKNQHHAADIPQPIYNRQVDEILTYINQNLDRALSLQELAQNFYLSESYICRIFKQATGTSIRKYITAQRIVLAKSLLTDGNSVKDTCELCGFHDYSNFLKSFSNAVGISPKKYAKFMS
ncbi:MAG: AraC family transcriptional regulator [Lachnospiraceae bacterium]